MTATIGIVLHPRRDPGEVATSLLEWARTQDVRVLARPEDALRCGAEASDDLAAEVDALVSLGGDGTMLGALRLVAKRPVPVLGVNLGNLGFLVEVEPDELPQALDRLEREEFTSRAAQRAAAGGRWRGDRRLQRRARSCACPATASSQAALAVGGQRLGRYRCDGIVGRHLGRIDRVRLRRRRTRRARPLLDAVIIAPLAPMAGIARPMVVSADEPVQLTLLEGSGRPASRSTGWCCIAPSPLETIEIRLQPAAGLVVRLDRDRHQRRNQVKLSLLDLPFLPDELRDLRSAP